MCHDPAMADASEKTLEAYVRASLALQGYRFDEAQTVEIAAQFARLEAIARSVFEWPLPSASEAAPVFRP